MSAPDQVDDHLREALTVCWRDVANAGGSVGFVQQTPVSDDVVRPEVDKIVEQLGRAHLLVAGEPDKVAGWLVLTTNASLAFRHWGLVTRVQTAPAVRGTGVARALLTELARYAKVDLRLASLRLDARGGEGLERFYEHFGWEVVGRYPEAIDLGGGDLRDQLYLNLSL
nr:GNAT family N-acetyltransferase [Kineosporia babensis]